MKRTSFYGILAVALVALLAVPFAWAQRRHAAGGPAGPDGMPMILGHLQHARQALDLSDQQVSDIRAIFQSLREQNAPYRDSLRGTMQQITQTLLNDPNNVAAAQALIDQQSQAERTMKTNALNAASKALNVLTPEQRTKLSSLIEERMQRRQRL